MACSSTTDTRRVCQRPGPNRCGTRSDDVHEQLGTRHIKRTIRYDTHRAVGPLFDDRLARLGRLVVFEQRSRPVHILERVRHSSQQAPRRKSLFVLRQVELSESGSGNAGASLAETQSAVRVPDAHHCGRGHGGLVGNNLEWWSIGRLHLRRSTHSSCHLHLPLS